MKHDWDGVFNTKQESKPDYFERTLIKIVFPLGSFLVGVIGLVNGARELPIWALAVLVAFVVIAAAALLSPPVVWAAKRIRGWHRRNRAARKHYSDVAQTIRRLHEHLGESTAHTLIYELRDFTSVYDKKGNHVIESLSGATNIREWLSTVGAKAARRRSGDFFEVAKNTSLAASQYRQLCESLYNRLQGVVSQGLLEDPVLRKLKNNWNSARDSYASMMQDWANTCDKINNDLGDYVGPSHFSPLRTLE